jgi:hypothetical protein
MGASGQCHAPAMLYPQEKVGCNVPEAFFYFIFSVFQNTENEYRHIQGEPLTTESRFSATKSVSAPVVIKCYK